MLPLARFNAFIQQHQLFDKQSTILAAVSGGVDSVLMAALLHACGYKFAIAHCNFMLRGDEALRDQQFCKELAHEYGVPFYTTNFDTTKYATEHKLSIQMAARNLRYQWFEQLRQQHSYDVITLAHHQNDTIETILLNLTRGTGIAGLHGIKLRNGYLVRPMLGFTREEIAQAVADEKLSFVEDSSNSSVKYARNKIRHDVIPKLKELNPNLENTFQEHLQHFAELEQLFEAKLEEIRKTAFTYHKGEVHIPINALKALSPMHLLLNGLLKPFGFNDTTTNDVIASLDKHSGRRFEAPLWHLVLDREKLIISPKGKDTASEVYINENDTDAAFGIYKFNISKAELPYEIKREPTVAAVDAGLLVYPLVLRTWQPGSYFYPLGMKVRKKLSDFFISLKTPLQRKSEIPLLVNGNGDIIWVAGLRMDNRYKITAETKKIAIFELTESA